MTSTDDQIPLVFRYGLHRVRDAVRVLPQAAWSVESNPALCDGQDYELLLDVERLNIDAASFRQMEEAARATGGDVDAGVRKQILDTVDKRGKMHNPVTGSGGMLLGRVRHIGNKLSPSHHALRPGDRVATLVSLSLTPLQIERILSVNLHAHQVSIIGSAILFDSGCYARLPPTLPESVALSALDVAGAAPQVARLCHDLRASKRVRRVLVLGAGGKSGLLVGAAARKAGAEVVVGIESFAKAASEAAALGIYDRILPADAADALAIADLACADGGEYDLVISCVSAPRAEMAAILCCRQGGTIYFFSMATSFTAAALGAEGVSRDIDMLIGNGYCLGHADETLQLLQEHTPLRELFVRRYG